MHKNQEYIFFEEKVSFYSEEVLSTYYRHKLILKINSKMYVEMAVSHTNTANLFIDENVY